MNCSNCSSTAIYVLDHERVSTVYYCGKCLPAHFRNAAAKGQLTIPAPKKKAVEPVVEASAESTEVLDENNED